MSAAKAFEKWIDSPVGCVCSNYLALRDVPDPSWALSEVRLKQAFLAGRASVRTKARRKKGER